MELNTQFHLVFHDSTGVLRLASILKGFEEASTVYVAQAQRWHPEIRRRADDEHQALIEAFRSRDADRAASVMQGHTGMWMEDDAAASVGRLSARASGHQLVKEPTESSGTRRNSWDDSISG